MDSTFILATHNLWAAYETAWTLEREASDLGHHFRVCRLIGSYPVPTLDGVDEYIYHSVDIPELLN